MCDYQATERGNLTAHQHSVHEGRIYPCNLCDYQATERGGLTKHPQSVHKEKKCDHEATTNGNLTRHQPSVHEGRTYYCNQCSSQFRLKISLKNTSSQYMKGSNMNVMLYKFTAHFGES